MRSAHFDIDHSHLQIASPDSMAEDFDGEIVALNLASGLYFSLRGLAAAIWRDLIAGHSPAALSAAIVQIEPGLDGEVRRFIRELVERGLLRPQPTSRTDGAIESICHVQAGECRLELEAFEDMKDIIVSDPIHDVDETVGWPTPQQPS
jgi:hypothetical protein